jgi:hypothetical protein
MKIVNLLYMLTLFGINIINAETDSPNLRLSKLVAHDPYNWKEIEKALNDGAYTGQFKEGYMGSGINTLQAFIIGVQEYTYPTTKRSPDFFPIKSLKLLLASPDANPLEECTVVGQYQEVTRYPSLYDTLKKLASDPTTNGKYQEALGIVEKWIKDKEEEEETNLVKKYA